jgi:RNA polymerase sigma factor (TIGR02999 family)
MSSGSEASITRLLRDLDVGGAGAADALLAAVYGELHEMARTRMAELPPGQSLQPTALVHDAYFKIFGNENPTWDNRRHFFMAAARAMRNLLVDQARHRARQKRGGGRERVDLDRLSIAASSPPEAIVALNEAVEKLDAKRREIVELRFFAGLTMEESAKTLDVPLRTLEREWRYVRARLRKDLSESDEPPPSGGSDV